MLDGGEKRELDRLSRDGGLLRAGAFVEQAIRVRLKPGEIGGRLRTSAELRCGPRVVWQNALGPALEDP
jgi:hypothetical protein